MIISFGFLLSITLFRSFVSSLDFLFGSLFLVTSGNNLSSLFMFLVELNKRCFARLGSRNNGLISESISSLQHSGSDLSESFESFGIQSMAFGFEDSRQRFTSNFSMESNLSFSLGGCFASLCFFRLQKSSFLSLCPVFPFGVEGDVCWVSSPSSSSSREH